MYFNGHGVEQDYERAFDIYQMAAEMASTLFLDDFWPEKHYHHSMS